MTRNRGYTLIELMIVMVVLVGVSMAITAMATMLNRTAQMQEANITAMDEASMGITLLSRELRQALAGTIVIDDQNLPADSISYQVPVDLDGNGNAFDVAGTLETSNLRTIAPDVNDANNDGLSMSQLVMTEAGSNNVFVVTNGLFNEDRDGNGQLNGAEDRDNDGILDTGIDFALDANGNLQIILTTGRIGEIRAGRQGERLETMYVTTLAETVVPRN